MTSQLPRESKKRKAVAAGRRSFVRQFLHDHPRCQVRWDGGCTGTATAVHEPLTRARGGSITDPTNAVATCWWCHAQVHANPEAATARGFLRSQFAGRRPDLVLVESPPAPDTQTRIRQEAERWLRRSEG